VDSIHGDIELTPREWRIVDTASFQRLRYIKQLGMGHLVYPNATHTRFAHSIGVLGVMGRILNTAKQNELDYLSQERIDDLRLAALLHDVGHYPYSHLLEGVDSVQLAEDFIHEPGRSQEWMAGPRYPKHVQVGQIIVRSQQDLVAAIGDQERAGRVADLFGRTAAADSQWSKLISSSFDMDRLDYLVRDSQAAGVPYGSIDLNYLLNALRVSPKGMVGVSDKALPAAEQYLFARYFMHRTVYWHKTTYAFEEAARQIIRRIRDQREKAMEYGLPQDEAAVLDLVKSERLRTFTDAYLDALLERATRDADEAISTISKALLDRRPAKLLREVCDVQEAEALGAKATKFRMNCKHRLSELARGANMPLWRFMYCETAPLRLEKRGPELSISEARQQPPEEADELIKVFRDEEAEPVSLVDIEHSIIRRSANCAVRLFRLYVIDDGQTDQNRYKALRESVRNWETA